MYRVRGLFTVSAPWWDRSTDTKWYEGSILIKKSRPKWLHLRIGYVVEELYAKSFKALKKKNRTYADIVMKWIKHFELLIHIM